MAPENIYLSSFAHGLGEPIPLAELPELADEALRQQYSDDGLAMIRSTADDPWQLAAACSKDTLSRFSGEVAHDTAVSRVVYATGSYWASEATQKAPMRYLDQVGLSRIPLLATGFHGCANAGPMIDIAANAVRAGHHAILCVTTDAAGLDSRLMSSNLSILSDGAASFIVGDQLPTKGFRLLACEIAVEAGMHALDPATDTMAALKGTVEGVSRAAASAFAVAGLAPGDVSHVVTNNYGGSGRQIFCAAAKLDFALAHDAGIALIGHSFSADTLIGLEQLADSGMLTQGDVVACLWTGLTTWSVGLLEYVER